MTNIPTDLLRTLIAVVDMRSFTRAAGFLGVTQPAVSAQIKRLQQLLGGDLFDRTTQGITLTPHGEVVVSFARRLLSINDEIVGLAGEVPDEELTIRVGTSSDYIASLLPETLANFRLCAPDVRFNVRNDFTDPLMRQLRNGEIDVVIALTDTKPHDARHVSEREVVWVRSEHTQLINGQPVPLVTYGEPCVYYQLVQHTLRAARREFETVFTGPSLNSLRSAVAAGLGVMALTRRRDYGDGLSAWQDAPLPRLPNLYSGIYVREGGARAVYERLADDIAAALYGPVNGIVLMKEGTAA